MSGAKLARLASELGGQRLPAQRGFRRQCLGCGVGFVGCTTGIVTDVRFHSDLSPALVKRSPSLLSPMLPRKRKMMVKLRRSIHEERRRSLRRESNTFHMG